jgi:hypothetical protein
MKRKEAQGSVQAAGLTVVFVYAPFFIDVE